MNAEIQLAIERRAQARANRSVQIGGFSLLEVLCAILILGVALVGLTQALTTALGSSKESELQTSAALLAAGRVETLRAEGYIIDGEDEGDFGEGLALYHWKQTITKGSVDGLHEVKVVIEHTKTRKALFELDTMLFERPVDSTPKQSDRRKRDRAQQRGGGR